MKYSVVFAAATSLELCACNRQVTVRPGADPSQVEINGALSMPSGTTQTIAFLTNLRPDCSVIVVPLGRVVQDPDHGRITVATIEDFPVYSARSPLAKCDSTRTKGLRLSYSPDPGYVGGDQFRFDVFVNQRVLHNHIVENVL
jgi:hypothetical protein